MAKTLGG